MHVIHTQIPGELRSGEEVSSLRPSRRVRRRSGNEGQFAQVFL
jgi:hypothetical protein